ncbi:MAG: hypothetical protein QW701_02850 [Candidatus Nezhaarchaeales archaeon]
MGRTYLVVGDGNRPLLKSLKVSGVAKIVVSDKPLETFQLIEVLDLFKQFEQVVSLPLEISRDSNVILDLYSHASRLSVASKFASLKAYLRICEILTASAKAKCFNLYISYCGSLHSKLYARLKSMVDEEITC